MSYKFKRKISSGHEKHYIYLHYHCVVCNKMIEKGSKHSENIIKDKGLELVEHYCSQECFDKVHKKQKLSFWRKNLMWIIMGISVATLIIILIISNSI